MATFRQGGAAACLQSAGKVNDAPTGAFGMANHGSHLDFGTPVASIRRRCETQTHAHQIALCQPFRRDDSCAGRCGEKSAKQLIGLATCGATYGESDSEIRHAEIAARPIAAGFRIGIVAFFVKVCRNNGTNIITLAVSNALHCQSFKLFDVFGSCPSAV